MEMCVVFISSISFGNYGSKLDILQRIFCYMSSIFFFSCPSMAHRTTHAYAMKNVCVVCFFSFISICFLPHKIHEKKPLFPLLDYLIFPPIYISILSTLYHQPKRKIYHFLIFCWMFNKCDTKQLNWWCYFSISCEKKSIFRCIFDV